MNKHDKKQQPTKHPSHYLGCLECKFFKKGNCTKGELAKLTEEHTIQEFTEGKVSCDKKEERK